MGRPPLGKAGRTKVGSLKLTQLEEEALVAVYGTVNAGLRVAVDQLLVSKVHRTRAKASSVPQPATEKPAASLEQVSVPRCRIHPEWKVVHRWVDRGQEFTRKRCTTCGFEVEGLDHN